MGESLYIDGNGVFHLRAPEFRQPPVGKGTRMRCGLVLRPAKSTDAGDLEVTCLGCTMNLTKEQVEGPEAAAIGEGYLGLHASFP